MHYYLQNLKTPPKFILEDWFEFKIRNWESIRTFIFHTTVQNISQDLRHAFKIKKTNGSDFWTCKGVQKIT